MDERGSEREQELFDAVRSQRAGLRRALMELEDAVAAPATGRADVWAKHVGESLRAVARAWSVHTDVTESSGGLFDEIVAVAPRLANAVKRLREDHVGLAAMLATEVQEIERAPSFEQADAWSAGRRDALMLLMGRFVRHRQKGADLMYEAYDVELGGED